MHKKVFGFAGYSGAGKTTLIEQLIPRFVQAGLRVSLIKHAHHAFDIDKPGKDSYRHREAGANELRDEAQPSLEEQLARFAPCDLVLVEGFKRAAIPKLEVFRPSFERPLLHPDDANIVAIAADAPVQTALPLLDLNNPDAIAEFIIRHQGLEQRAV